MQLKNYQIQTLDYLQRYLEAARLYDNKAAYEKIQKQRFGSQVFPPFQPLEGLEDVPYICLRLPTGGGKTLLSTHSIKLAGKIFWDNGRPLTLIMVPTTTIKNQTLETLTNPHHPNAKALTAAFGGDFRVFDVADFSSLRRQDIENKACIIVATFASLRVEDTQGRRVYDHHEELEGHFTDIATNSACLEHCPKSGNRFLDKKCGKNKKLEHLVECPSETKNAIERNDEGQIKYSFANLLALHRPLVLLDEAHNAKSDLSMEVLRRINPRIVIEYTATPAKNSNVIQSVTAAQLKAEQMIKLPIQLYVHASWQMAVLAALQNRASLEQIAQKDKDYIRPLILFQAENKGGDVTIDVLRQFLLDQDIAEEQIAIATGEQRELDKLNLFDANCPVRYIITVQALKEGWDCSFAYILCSVANTRSPTAVEQLLGRVLRMPYARSRQAAELNLAYAHVSTKSWPQAADRLADRLVNMGFERQEAAAFTYQHNLPLEGEEPAVTLTLTQKPDLSNFDLIEKSQVSVQETTDKKFQVTIAADADKALLKKFEQALPNEQAREAFQLQLKQAHSPREKQLAPVEQGVKFCLPQLCLQFDSRTSLLETESVFGDEGFDPLTSYTPLTKIDFSLDEQTQIYSGDIEGDKIRIIPLPSEQQLVFKEFLPQLSVETIAAKIAANIYNPVEAQKMRQGTFIRYIQKTCQDLSNRDDMDLTKLARGQFLLEKLLISRLNNAHIKAREIGLKKLLLPPDPRLTTDLKNHGFDFPQDYPAERFYEGRLKFTKHYYRLVGDMNKEEALCAQILDGHERIKFWLRNLERQSNHAFNFPTSSDLFYPDFVAQLDDGRILIVEYKGEHLKTNDDTKEKTLIGKVWARLSGNLFLLASKRDDKGRDIRAQLEYALS